MARLEHHAAYGFLSYYVIYLLLEGFLMPGWVAFLAIFWGIFPDLDTVYWVLKKGGTMDTEFQHHLYFWTHWPISYLPLVVTFLVSLIFNFYPLYFLIPVIGVFCGHLIPDSISTGDGIMWLKIPWKRNQYARYINIFSSSCDGYHGRYWEYRYHRTVFFWMGHGLAFLSATLILIFQLLSTQLNVYYLLSMIFLFSATFLGLRPIPERYGKEPPEGRYADYRINPRYIQGLSEKTKKAHLKKYSRLLEQSKNKD